MRGLVVFLLILAGLSLFSFMALSSGINKENIEQNSKDIQFKTFTSAVCEEKSGFVYCRDELFVNCNGKISRANEIGECNGFKINNEVVGFAVFEKEWAGNRA